MMGSAESGANICGLRVGSAPINRLGITPTTLNGTLAMMSLRPTTSGARSNHVSQNCSVITTARPSGFPPGRSSSGVRYLPIKGAVCSARKNCPLTSIPGMFSFADRPCTCSVSAL